MYDATPDLVYDLQRYAGDTLATEQASAHVEAAISFVNAYTRGVGFDDQKIPNDELRSVIVSLAARSMGNPQGVQNETVGAFSVNYFKVGVPTLAERAILDRYRVKAL